MTVNQHMMTYTQQSWQSYESEVVHGLLLPEKVSAAHQSAKW